MPIAQAPFTARRILVYGVTGAGKSTAAMRIGRLAGLPCTLADELTWNPNWVQVPDEEQRRRIAAVVAADEWVLDTAYNKWKDLPLSRAQLIVGLDYPRWLSLGRLIRRTFARLVTRQPVCNGNVETLRVIFGRDSILVWHFQSFKRKQARMREWAAALDGPPVLLFRHPRELESWLGELGAGAAG
jgi:adenylate kinase family enzyme